MRVLALRLMAAQASRNVREDFVAVLELDAERRTRVDLLDRAEHLDHRLLRRLVDPFDPLRGWFPALGRTYWPAVSCTKECNFTRFLTYAGAQGLQPPEIFIGFSGGRRNDPRLRGRTGERPDPRLDGIRFAGEGGRGCRSRRP